jgi:hypothetical protein
MEYYVYEGQTCDEDCDLDVSAEMQSPEQARQKKQIFGI